MGSSPKRLNKKSDKTRFECFCNKIAPYVIFICIIILLIIIFIAIVKYGGSITGTEANQYYYGGWRQ